MKNKPDTRRNMKLKMKRGEVCEERAAQGYMEAQKRSLTEDRKALKERGEEVTILERSQVKCVMQKWKMTAEEGVQTLQRSQSTTFEKSCDLINM